MAKRIIFLTIGEAPRKDLQDIYEEYFSNVEGVEQIGLLDGLSHEEAVEKFGLTEKEKPSLTSRFIDGYQVIMSQSKVESKLQKMIDRLEQEGTEVIALLCTGEFKNLSTKKAELITAEEIVIPYIKESYSNQTIGVVNPLQRQIEDSKHKWQLKQASFFTAASPYNGKESEFISAANFFISKQVKVVVMDCIGYNKKMQSILKNQLNNIPIYLSNELLFKYIYNKFC